MTKFIFSSPSHQAGASWICRHSRHHAAERLLSHLGGAGRGQTAWRTRARLYLLPWKAEPKRAAPERERHPESPAPSRRCRRQPQLRRRQICAPVQGSPAAGQHPQDEGWARPPAQRFAEGGEAPNAAPQSLLAAGCPGHLGCPRETRQREGAEAGAALVKGAPGAPPRRHLCLPQQRPWTVAAVPCSPGQHSTRSRHHDAAILCIQHASCYRIACVQRGGALAQVLWKPSKAGQLGHKLGAQRPLQ